MIRVSVTVFWLLVLVDGPSVTANTTEPWELPPRLMQYQFNGLASGTLGEVAFTDAAIDVMAIGETSQIERRLISGSFTSLWVENQRASINIEGIGQAVFTQITETWTRENLIGFARDFETYLSLGADLVTVDVHSQMPSYSLYDDLLPFAVDNFLVVENQFVDIQTSLGMLTLRPGSLRSGAFSAMVLPEPSLAAIAMTGLLLACPFRTRGGSPRSHGTS